MNAHKIETILSEDGALILKGLPFHIGDAVEVIILERSRSVSTQESSSQIKNAVIDEAEANSYPLRGTVLHYEDPFEPAVPIEDWDVLQ
jgi:hypothetical protein